MKPSESHATTRRPINYFEHEPPQKLNQKRASLEDKDAFPRLETTEMDSKEEKRLREQHKSFAEIVEESVQNRDLRFRRRANEDVFVVDIIDRRTGDVIRSLPEVEFNQFMERLQEKTAGSTLNIDG